ncbi:NUDIX hydrolase [Actinomycetospora endophytica]|uniref:NUDIX hydrolase n=1 Tax=Actinomycetospora endophytica TaxID=2291215 RepID=A0ABS8PFM9_9PSEU|nr:NUDIX domain-containing protein [Actinomycetospora endophytica]MCD2197070.1 NUDIX hydrolase [Actinomycetospora endophytica]
MIPPDGLMLPDGNSGTVTPDEDVPRSVHAAGAVLWREGRHGREVAVVHRPHHQDWSLPKGKVDPGESRARTAVREIAEETGFAAALGRHLATVRYPVGADRKVVDYWEARAGDGSFTPNGETDELRWLAPSEAAGLLTYGSDRDVLDTFTAAPHPLASLLLVRHAKAGKRGSWADDDERPLVEEGRDQARRVADLVTAHGVRRLYAAPRVRCRETLEPASHRLGVGISDAAALADEAVAEDPVGARGFLLDLVAGETTAICAQGYGIPTLVRDLASDGSDGPRPEIASNRRLTEPPSRKGSVWTLTFHTVTGEVPRLVAADYVRDPAV